MFYHFLPQESLGQDFNLGIIYFLHLIYFIHHRLRRKITAPFINKRTFAPGFAGKN